MTTQTPAGWYPDPYGSPQLRWWDGNQWTDATHPLEQTGPHAQQTGQQSGPHGQQSGPQLQQGPPPAAQPSGAQSPASGPHPAAPTPAGPAPATPAPATPSPAGPFPAGPASDPQPVSAHPANPTQQYGQQPWGGGTAQLPMPDFGQPPPQKSSALPWILAGIGALVVIGLIAAGAIFVINRGDGAIAAQPTPAQTLEQTPPPETSPSPSPSASTNRPETAFPQPADGWITDPGTGLTYRAPGTPWAIPDAATLNSDNPAVQQWTSAVEAISHENYDGEDDWKGNVLTGPLSARYPYAGENDLKGAVATVYHDFAQFYPVQHEVKVLRDKAIKVGDRVGHLMEFEFDYTKGSEGKGYKWKTERVALAIVDAGEGERPSLVYISVPDNLGTSVVSQVLKSLKVS